MKDAHRGDLLTRLSDAKVLRNPPGGWLIWAVGGMTVITAAISQWQRGTIEHSAPMTTQQPSTVHAQTPPVRSIPPFNATANDAGGLPGVDSDANGIRDDIDTWLLALQLPSHHERAVQTYAQTLQGVYSLRPSNSSAISIHIAKVTQALSCVEEAMKDRAYPFHWTQIAGRIDAYTFNTPERKQAMTAAYAKADLSEVFSAATASAVCAGQLPADGHGAKRSPTKKVAPPSQNLASP